MLIEQGWGTKSLARYLELRYDEVIPPSSLRTWRGRKLKALEAAGKLPERWKTPGPDASDIDRRIHAVKTIPDELPDVLTRRIQLAQMQEARLMIDHQHEVAMGKLFSGQVKEIDMLNRLWDSIKSDMQDLGMFPKVDSGSPSVTVNTGNQVAVMSGGASQQAGTTTLLERLGMPREAIKDAARALVVVRSAEAG